MTNQEAIEELQLTIDLIKQNGKDWLDERDIPILSIAIEAMKELNALREQNSSSQMSGTSDAEFWKKRALEYSKTCCDLLARLSNGTKVDSIQLNENDISFHMSTQSEQNLPTQMSGTSEDAVSRNAIIQKLNTMDRYVSEELRLCDTEKRFPKNEVFIVDDVYEEIVESLPSVQPELEDKIRAIGYTGKEGRIYIGGRLFAVRELPQ